MKESIKLGLNALKSFLIEWNEFLTIPLSLVMFWLGGLLIRGVDPSSGLFDPGIFQIILWAVSAFLFLHGVSWLVIRITFPRLYKFLDTVFDYELDYNAGDLIPDDSKLTKYQKCVLSLVYFFGCLFAMVLLARVIM